MSGPGGNSESERFKPSRGGTGRSVGMSMNGFSLEMFRLVIDFLHHYLLEVAEVDSRHSS